MENLEIAQNSGPESSVSKIRERLRNEINERFSMESTINLRSPKSQQSVSVPPNIDSNQKSESFEKSDSQSENINSFKLMNDESLFFTSSSKSQDVENKKIPKEEKESIRCVCNLSQCASTNYMCKSERIINEDGLELDPGCFSEEVETDSNLNPSSSNVLFEKSNPARRGCIHTLSSEKQKQCLNGSGGSSVQCCFNEDMCNYRRTYPPSNFNFNKINSNQNSYNRLPFDPNNGLSLNGRVGASLEHQVWLHAAVIAIPICGLMILLILIYVARKLLSGEEEFSHKSNYIAYHPYPQNLKRNLQLERQLVTSCHFCLERGGNSLVNEENNETVSQQFPSVFSPSDERLSCCSSRIIDNSNTQGNNLHSVGKNNGKMDLLLRLKKLVRQKHESSNSSNSSVSV